MALNYLVRDDDTPQRVAARNYGKWELYPLILDNNKILLKGLPENTLRMGIIINIPIPPALTTEFKHKVKEGDTYFNLAELYYESVSMARKLEHENQYLSLKKNIGSEILIPALVGKKIYENARSILNA